MTRAPVGGFVLAALFALAGCSSGEKLQAGECNSNADCPAVGARCRTETRECICISDRACDGDEFCNGAGVCQARTGCRDNGECGAGNFCDLVSGECLPGPPAQLDSRCNQATHCPYNTVCQAGTCEVGCFDDGDCVLGQVCFEGLCSTGEGLCSNDQFCALGARCVENGCEEDRRGPYCAGCTTRTSQNPDPCGGARNFCLINSLERDGFRNICGVDCSSGEACPNGFRCNSVVILTEQTCTGSAQCQCSAADLFAPPGSCTLETACEAVPSAGDPTGSFCVVPNFPGCGEGRPCVVPDGATAGACACVQDADCGEAGASCVSGLCCRGETQPERACESGESQVTGFCTCQIDTDCPRDQCDPTRGACLITGRPCSGSEDCGPIACIDGGCVIGQNCSPSEGITCSDVNR